MKPIKLFIMDVDGTLTDGRIYMGQQGELCKAFHSKDGYAIYNILPEYFILPVIITGRESRILELRAEELNIRELHQGASSKIEILKEVLQRYGVLPAECAYIGDDLNDMECMRLCGLIGCPADAVKEIKEIADFISTKNGGEGAVRDFIEWIIR